MCFFWLINVSMSIKNNACFMEEMDLIFLVMLVNEDIRHLKYARRPLWRYEDVSRSHKSGWSEKSPGEWM